MPVQHLALASRDGNNCLNNFLMFRTTAFLEIIARLTFFAESAIMICGCECMMMISTNDTTRCVLCAKYQRFFRAVASGHGLRACVRQTIENSRENSIFTHSQPENKWKRKRSVKQSHYNRRTLFRRRKSELKYSSLWKRTRSRLTFQLESSFGCEKKFLRKRRKFCFVDSVLEIWTREVLLLSAIGGCLPFLCFRKSKTRVFGFSIRTMWCDAIACDVDFLSR